MEAQRITGPGRAREVAVALNSPRRGRPAVVVSVSGSADRPWIDADRIATELEGLADVYVLARPEVTWAFTEAMPPGTQIYGGAGRFYPPGLAWVRDLKQAPIRFAYSPDEGVAATERLIEDGVTTAARAGLLDGPRGPATREITGTVRGCPTPSQAWVDRADGGWAMITTNLVAPGVPADRLFRPGMPVRGRLDTATLRLDVRAMVPDPATRVADLRPGSAVLVRVEQVEAGWCEVAFVPGAAVRVPRAAITDEDDDLRDLVSVGEVIAVRVLADDSTDTVLALVDPDHERAPVEALAVLPGGPPWLVAAVPEPAPEQAPEPAAERAPEPGPVKGPAPAPDPAPPPIPRPRPTPALLAVRAGQAPEPPATLGSPSPGAALRTAQQNLAAARNQVAHLENQARAREDAIRSLTAEVTQLKQELQQRTRSLERTDRDLRRLRRTHLKDVQQRNTPGDTLFLDGEEQFRYEVQERWALRIPAADKAARPLRPYRFGPRFLASLTEVGGIDRRKVVDVVVEVLTGLVDALPGRETHQLRAGTGPEDGPLRRDGATCWRVSLQRNTPQARRLHYWRGADGIELARVVLHDDFGA